ncbi:MAG: cytochrome c biogenesis protein CcsA [bacterium]|nr:cytochrome c biogenesis protein CcsA [bacterium]
MAYLGDLFIFGAAASSLLSLVFYLLVWRGKETYRGLARNFSWLTAGLITLAIADLLYLIVTHDFTVAYVYSYSSTDLPLGFLISSLWGGQEGTFLLWIFFVSILSLVMLHTAGKFEASNMFFVNLFLLSVMLIIIKKSPFELMPVFRAEGAGLNPLLQNFWMQIHPPIMFVGFSGVVFPFAFAMTALVTRKYATWAESARRWTLFAWAALGISLIMGGYWAYVTLGWGGFWAWDPVENSSFIPWVFLTAQVHALFIKRQRSGLLRFSLIVTCISFLSVLYGTFLTRSGVLADFSVHSFVDLGINQFLISGLLFFTALSLFFIVWRWQDIHPEPSFSTVNSRSYLVTLGVLILSLGGMLVLVGTSAPLLTRVTGEPSAVGLPYYFATMTPVAIVVMFLITLVPAYRWNEGVAKPKLLISGAIAAGLTIAALMTFGVTFRIIYLLFFGMAASALVTNGWVIIQSWRARSFIPGYLAHVGLAIAMIGAAASAGFENKQTITLSQNEITEAMGYQMQFTDLVENSKGFDCHVEISGPDGDFLAVLPHEFPKNAEGVMRKPYVSSYLMYDLYVAPVAFEPAEGSGPGELILEKGASATLDKYEITFHEFDLDSHDESGPAIASAKVTVSFDGKSEDLAPALKVTDDGVVPVGASFDYDKGTIFVSGISPENGSVVLRVVGDFLSPVDTKSASLVIELSEKPLILLFWIGCVVVFGSGLLSMRERRRRKRSERVQQSNRLVQETVSG